MKIQKLKCTCINRVIAHLNNGPTPSMHGNFVTCISSIGYLQVTLCLCFQNESMCEPIRMKTSLICMKMDL